MSTPVNLSDERFAREHGGWGVWYEVCRSCWHAWVGVSPGADITPDGTECPRCGSMDGHAVLKDEWDAVRVGGAKVLPLPVVNMYFGKPVLVGPPEPSRNSARALIHRLVRRARAMLGRRELR